MAVGMHYVDFRQTSDAEVPELLEGSRRERQGRTE
jgi:predicted phosphoribosyltransferase